MSYFDTEWFQKPGAYVLVDGQFGSTGKGLLAGWLTQYMDKVNKITTNAGPNSGHTAYYQRPGHTLNYHIEGETAFEKIVTQQLPVASVFLDRMGHKFDTIINAGAVVDYEILEDEIDLYLKRDHNNLLIHPTAALINQIARNTDKRTTEKIAGTGKGIGPAMQMKMGRLNGKEVVASHRYLPYLPEGYKSWDDMWDWKKDVVFVETAQGFSLGLNSGRFYPHVTSRECTVQQALADARIPAQMLRKVVACFRTYPIRVGNTTGSSGDCYPDQEETTWEALGLEPELTTVTKRVRRVFSWSDTQFSECVAANRPNVLFLNFANYMAPHETWALVERMEDMYVGIMGKTPECILIGSGPYNSDVLPFGRWLEENIIDPIRTKNNG